MEDQDGSKLIGTWRLTAAYVNASRSKRESSTRS